jgi:hypothetical protein
VFLAGVGCGKELNADFCDAHSTDERCLATAAADASIDATSIDMTQLPSCPTTYTVTLANSASKYRVVDDSVLWPAAEADCEDDGTNTHLIVLNSDAERLALQPYSALERHIGYSDAVDEGTWIPVTDDPDIYDDLVMLKVPPWGGGEPNQGSGGNCLAIATGLDFRDRTCESEPASYICECDAYPADSANF